MKKVIGKAVEFEVITESGSEMRRATVKNVVFSKIGVIYEAITPFGNSVRLTRGEISRFLP